MTSVIGRPYAFPPHPSEYSGRGRPHGCQEDFRIYQFGASIARRKKRGEPSCQVDRHADIERAFRSYIDACEEAVAACLTPDAVHCFPTGPKWSGAATIAGNFSKGVQARGLFWTVDHIAVEAAGSQASWNGRNSKRLVASFAASTGSPSNPGPIGLVKFGPMAAPVQPDLTAQELPDFDYAGRDIPRLGWLEPASAPMRPKVAALSPAACGRTRRLRRGGERSNGPRRFQSARMKAACGSTAGSTADFR